MKKKSTKTNASSNSIRMTMASTTAVNDENSAGAANNNSASTKPSDLEHEAVLGGSAAGNAFLNGPPPRGGGGGLLPVGGGGDNSPLHGQVGPHGLWPPPPPPPPQQWIPPEAVEPPTYTPLVKVRKLPDSPMFSYDNKSCSTNQFIDPIVAFLAFLLVTFSNVKTRNPSLSLESPINSTLGKNAVPLFFVLFSALKSGSQSCFSSFFNFFFFLTIEHENRKP